MSDGRVIIRNSLVDFQVSTQIGTPPVTLGSNQSVASTIGDSFINNSPVVNTPSGGVVNISHPGLLENGVISPFKATSARLAWLLDDGTDATFSGNLQVDLEVYATPMQPKSNSGVLSIGGIVPTRAIAIDDTHILALAPAHEDPMKQISIQVVSRAGVMMIVEPKRRAVLNYRYDNNKPQRISVAVNKNRGYIFSTATGDTPVPSADLRIIAPRCDSP
jgi:hypothetical protein